jgi:hypothetical protein
MNALSKFGFLLTSASSIGIVILKTLVRYRLFLNTWLYTDLSALAILFGFIVSIAIVLMLSPIMKNFIVLLITFILTLGLVYAFIVPVYLVGV